MKTVDDENGARIYYQPRYGQPSSEEEFKAEPEKSEKAKPYSAQSCYGYIDFLHREVGNITLLQAKVLLYVLLNPGVIQKDIVDLFRENAPTISRIIKFFGFRTVRDPKTRRLTQVGMDLIKTTGDPNDHRALALYPTGKGKQLLAKIQGLR